VVTTDAPARPARGRPTGGERRAGARVDWPAPRVLVPLAVLVLLVGLVLDFTTTSHLWLDEALTVDIARLPLGQIHQHLLHDGAPPLFYVLLHVWMGVFGTSDVAVRALSGCFACAMVPLVWVAARRLGGPVVAAAAVLLTVTSPFVVRYATETRMYALVMLLTAAGTVALQRALRRPRAGNLLAVALCGALLLYTHYWALYLVAVTGAWLLWRWRWGPGEQRRGAGAALGALAVGCVAFVPWVPTFLYQARHTGTPWAAPADFAAMVNAVSSFAGGGTNQGRALGLLYFALAGVGLLGVTAGRFTIELDLRTRPRARGLAVVLVGTLALAIVFGYVSRSAFSARYAAVVFVPLVLLVALGTATIGDRWARTAVVGAAVVFGLAGSVPNVWAQRTQAGQVAAVLQRLGRPGDVVAYCPDQLGPDVARLLPDTYVQTTFPRRTSPRFVDWVDYARHTETASPAAFASYVERLSGGVHQIWLVWAPGYQTYGTKCESIETHLLADRSLGAREQFAPNGRRYYEPMELVRFVPLRPAAPASGPGS